MDKVCSVDYCNGKVLAREWCSRHYFRWRKYGNPITTKYNVGIGETQEQRFWSKVAITSNVDRCWIWLGCGDHRGYFYFQGRMQSVHRIAWTIINGREPSKFILHSCDNPICCNPKHLREGTQQENMQDKVDRNRHFGWRKDRV